MCDCKNVKIGSYDNQIELKIPNNIKLEYNNPKKEKRETVCIDKCLVDEIKYLWNIGIRTTGCCCGHNIQQGYIGVIDKDISQMKNLGYTVAHNTCRPNDEDSFVPKKYNGNNKMRWSNGLPNNDKSLKAR